MVTTAAAVRAAPGSRLLLLARPAGWPRCNTLTLPSFAMAYVKSVNNITLTGAKLLIEAAEAKASEIVSAYSKLLRRCCLTYRGPGRPAVAHDCLLLANAAAGRESR